MPVKLLVPSGYGPLPIVTGPVGARPDIEILDRSFDRCRRHGLPSFVQQLTFTIGRSRSSREQDRGHTSRQNFYHFGEFFLMSETVLRLFEHYLADFIQAKKVRTQSSDGEPTKDPFWAVTVNQIIDCIDPDLSKLASFRVVKLKSFSEEMIEILLTDACAAEFSNDGYARYCSYGSFAKSIVLRPSIDLEKTAIFQAKFWPGHYFISSSFERELGAICKGGIDGYYFWTLPLEDLTGGHISLMTSLR